MRAYVSQFHLLAKSGVDLINTPMKKASKFAWALNLPLMRFGTLPHSDGSTFESLVEIALLHEISHGVREKWSRWDERRNSFRRTRRRASLGSQDQAH